MRQERTVQASVFDLFAMHEIGHELKAMPQWLDEHRDVLGLVVRVLGRVASRTPDGRGCRPKRYCAARSSSNTAN